MKKTIKGVISVLLVLSMLLSTSMVVFAAKEEVYLSDLRLVYANSYDEAKRVLSETKLQGYQLLNCNLNTNSGFVNSMLGTTGVWLAYKTTTDIDDAITDISIMQMGGGYSEGNFQEMIKKSKDEYLAMGRIYLDAVDYFAQAYDAGNFLAESAYRQLNFYTGLDDFDDDKLGHIFANLVVFATDLATLFMQGNSYVLNNIRSLLAMGVSYNEEGLHYLQRVSLLASGTYNGYMDESLKDVTADDINIEDEEDIDVLAALIAANIPTFRKMFEELSAYEAELNYEDETFTDLELKYAEHKAMADMMRAVNYLNGQSLYDFVMSYTLDTNDYSSLYPLAQALNKGQIAMTKVMHYYDVVRYSMNEGPEELIDERIAELEAKYANNPIDVYTGVDRDMYNGTFALTSAASRADAYTDSASLAEVLFGNGAWVATGAQIAAGAVGIGLFTWAIVRSAKKAPVQDVYTNFFVENGVQSLDKQIASLNNNFGSFRLDQVGWDGASYIPKGTGLFENSGTSSELVGQYLARMMNRCAPENIPTTEGQIEYLSKMLNDGFKFGSDVEIQQFEAIRHDYYNRVQAITDWNAADEKLLAENAIKSTTTSWGTRFFTGALYVFGALSTAYSAISLYTKVYDYYHPEYEVIPEAMVDLVRTVDGDRYIKYDVVLEAKMRDGEYHAGDLNAFKGQRWNALYYTKSYEAGKPLLAEFAVSNVSNRAESGHLAVHRFGETVCYDLNKYNFNSSSENVFLSVAQSENQKSAVTDVPEVVGSIFGAGIWFIAGTLGVALGIGGTLGTQFLLNKKKKEI